MTAETTPETYDCIVIGGGPAGLTAAIYLARYHLSVIVFDDLTGRAASIPISHNHAGFPDGISGVDLLARMRTQAVKYGCLLRHERVFAIFREGELLAARTALGTTRARAVLLATGVADRRPMMPPAQHDEAVARGLIRYCPVCDGFEATDRTIGVIGTGERAAREAVFLRSYSSDVTLLAPAGPHRFSDDTSRLLDECAIELVSGPVMAFELKKDEIVLSLATTARSFATLYCALGSDSRSGLVEGLGAQRSDDGCVVVDDHQRSSVRGLYAAGDVVIGLDQMSHAMGQAGVAATAIRNDLCRSSIILRP